MDDCELSEILEEKSYEYKNVIGKGGSSICYLVYSLKYRDNYACKTFMFAKSESCITCEHDALKQLNSPGVIKLYDYVIKPSAEYLFLEFCPGGTLQDYIQMHGEK